MIRVKARLNGDAWELDVLGVPYGGHNEGRDADDQFFDSTTKLHADKYGLPTATVYHSLKDDGSGLTESVEYVGRATGYEDKQDGRWYRVVLDKLSPSAAKLWEAAKNGVLTVSSGTASHLARFNEATGHIKEWPVFELAMIHGGEGKSPANKFAIAIPRLKAMGIVCPQTTGASKDSVMGSACATGAATKSELQKQEVIMSDKDETQTAPPIDMAALGALMETAVKSAVAPIEKRLDEMENVPDAPIGHAAKADITMTMDETDKKLAAEPNKLGVTLQAIKAAKVSPSGLTPMFKAILGQNESVPEMGGFLVGTEMDSGLEKKVHESGVFAGGVSMRQITSGNNAVDFYGISENSRKAGSRWGGIQGYRVAEGQPITASEMKFYKYTLKPEKYAVVNYQTDEVMSDSRLLQQEIMNAVPQELAFMLDEDIYGGTFAGYAKGFIESNALKVVPKETGQPATTIVYENITKMWAAMWSRSKLNSMWYINPDIFPQLAALEDGNGNAIFMPPGGLSGSPYGTLLGRPIMETEFNETLGTVGDIVLADMSQYKVAGIGGVKSAASIHVEFLTDQHTFRFTSRYDGQVTWESALTPNKGTNTVSPFVALATRS